MKLYNRRNFFKFIAKGAAIVGAAGVFGLPEVEAKEYKYEFNHMLWEATITDSNDNIVEVYQLRDYVVYGADKFVEKLRQDYIKYDLVELKDWADDIEQSLVGSFDGLDGRIEYSTQSGTHWPNDTCQTVLAGDMITTDGGVTWTTLELGLDEDDKITRLDYVFGQIYLETLKDRYFLSEDCENFIEYYPDNYYIKVKES